MAGIVGRLVFWEKKKKEKGRQKNKEKENCWEYFQSALAAFGHLAKFLNTTFPNCFMIIIFLFFFPFRENRTFFLIDI